MTFEDYRDKLEGGKYVLVPVEPTLDMIKAAYRLTHDHFGVELLYAPEDIYKAMIQAVQEEG